MLFFSGGALNDRAVGFGGGRGRGRRGLEAGDIAAAGKQKAAPSNMGAAQSRRLIPILAPSRTIHHVCYSCNVPAS